MAEKSSAGEYKKALRRLDEAIAARLRARHGRARGWLGVWRLGAQKLRAIFTFRRPGGG